MNTMPMISIVSPIWLNDHSNDPDLILLDASQESNVAGGSLNFGGIQIFNARHFDLKDQFSDKKSDLPNTLPSPIDFQLAAQKIGINNTSKIIIYDDRGIYTSPRVWWMFKAMGHENVAVLDGGLPNWIEHGYSTEPVQSKPFFNGDFTSTYRDEKIKNFQAVQTLSETQDSLIIDARSTDRFYSLIPEPRQGLRSGNIPNSVNFPFQDVLTNGKMKSPDELKSVFKSILNDDRPLVFSCGSGVTACISLLACNLILENELSVYDGSWTEWARFTVP
ncbi:MAG: thiosulfate/3-mercaptopyruvate sulfurtransferase [Flavobacteriaceae bacterium]|jgi:thiosulfate/3-mercaptopyruvate sulfurtransferase